MSSSKSNDVTASASLSEALQIQRYIPDDDRYEFQICIERTDYGPRNRTTTSGITSNPKTD